MTWVYVQKTGSLYHERDGSREFVDRGYAGRGIAKNDPSFQHVPDFGPLPVGHYTISAPYDSESLGRVVMRLLPFPNTEMFGREGFRIHGDRIGAPPGEASHGCVVLPLSTRQKIAVSGDSHWRTVSFETDLLIKECGS